MYVHRRSRCGCCCTTLHSREQKLRRSNWKGQQLLAKPQTIIYKPYALRSNRVTAHKSVKLDSEKFGICRGLRCMYSWRPLRRPPDRGGGPCCSFVACISLNQAYIEMNIPWKINSYMTTTENVARGGVLSGVQTLRPQRGRSQLSFRGFSILFFWYFKKLIEEF